MSRRISRARTLSGVYGQFLEDCKYCGGKAEIAHDGNTYCVYCGTSWCDSVTGTTLKDAIETWNEEHENI